MEQSKHTPGLFDGWSIGTNGRIYNKRGDLMATAGHRNIASEEEAIARLIAAAPELLKALQVLVDSCTQVSGTVPRIPNPAKVEAARAAIAKAEQS